VLNLQIGKISENSSLATSIKLNVQSFGAWEEWIYWMMRNNPCVFAHPASPQRLPLMLTHKDPYNFCRLLLNGLIAFNISDAGRS
jgi:hypothetical protein